MSKNVTKLNKSSLIIHAKRCSQSFAMHEITEEEVSISINNIKTHSAPGLDNISPKFIKLAKVVLVPFLTILFKKCIAQQTFSDNYKLAIVIPIPKNSSPKTINDFRPISLLPIFAKVRDI